MITLGLAIISLVLGLLILSSPYWLFKEMRRPDDEELPAWMGDARARKQRLAWILGAFVMLVGAGILYLSRVNR